MTSNVARDQTEKLKKVFGENTTWEFEGAPFGASVTNQYEYSLKLDENTPVSQENFDNIKTKFEPFAEQLLDKMKKVGVENPKISFYIWSVKGGPFQGSENLQFHWILER
ncbi:hypothetical protein [Lactococcus allomyrinae]|uniref:hypothetical protein n=1 Tax=Lactococcus allomyrinae TaxID=2419773 RepID=UPI0013C440AE|nr:hypothetical protein [Lactococcus allomyrinae]